MFKLNGQKTKVLLCKPLGRRGKVLVVCLSVGNASVSLSKMFKIRGVLNDSHLSFTDHMTSTIRAPDSVVWGLSVQYVYALDAKQQIQQP